MADDKKPWTFVNVLASLNEFAVEPDDDVAMMPIEQVHKELSAVDIDVEPLVRNVRSMLGDAKSRETLSLARERREQLLKNRERRNRTASGPMRSRQEMIDLIIARQAQRPESTGAFFRKLEESSDEDLESMIDDGELLEDIGRNEPNGATET
jgi:hypothetical protein